jgi:hypothetical protein
MLESTHLHLNQSVKPVHIIIRPNELQGYFSMKIFFASVKVDTEREGLGSELATDIHEIRIEVIHNAPFHYNSLKDFANKNRKSL